MATGEASPLAGVTRTRIIEEGAGEVEAGDDSEEHDEGGHDQASAGVYWEMRKDYAHE